LAPESGEGPFEHTNAPAPPSGNDSYDRPQPGGHVSGVLKHAHPPKQSLAVLFVPHEAAAPTTTARAITKAKRMLAHDRGAMDP
jgi:hypothetical protein